MCVVKSVARGAHAVSYDELLNDDGTQVLETNVPAARLRPPLGPWLAKTTGAVRFMLQGCSGAPRAGA